MLYNEYLAEIFRGQSQAKVLGKEGLSNKQVAAAYRGALEAAYNAEASNRDFALRKQLGEGNLAIQQGTLEMQQGALEMQQDRLEAEKQAETTRTMTQFGTLALTNSDKLVKGYNWLTGATTAPEVGLSAGTPAYTGAVSPAALSTGASAGEVGIGASGEAIMAYESGFEVGGAAGPAGWSSGEVGVAGGSSGEVGVVAGAAPYLASAGIGFAAGSMLGPMVGQILPFGGAKEKGAIGGAIAGGILGGMAAGAMMGTAVFPVVGTIIGAICGAIGGLIAGGK